jgi:hypothetical protein
MKLTHKGDDLDLLLIEEEARDEEEPLFDEVRDTGFRILTC